MSNHSHFSRTFVAGHEGLVGSAIVRALERGHGPPPIVRDRSSLDLTDGAAVEHFFATERPAIVYLAAGRVGGIRANSTYPAEFIRDNLAIQTNVIHAAWRSGVAKLLFLGSSCIYPRLAPQPIREDSLLTGPLEATNEWYAIAKIAGVKMCQAYRRQYGFNAVALMPTNLYGPNDNFSSEDCHVLPALMQRLHEAKLRSAPEVVVWGSGSPRREFLHVDDLAAAAVFVMDHYDGEGLLNVGTGEDVAIAELVSLLKRVIGYEGNIRYDASRPDGTPRKLLDVGRIHSLGWRHRIALGDGVAATYRWFVEHAGRVRSGSSVGGRFRGEQDSVSAERASG